MSPSTSGLPAGVSPFSIIAIDGPAASGKSTLGARLAQELGYLFFDTGVMYRAVTWLALHQGISVEAEAELTRLAQAADIDVCPPSAADGRMVDVCVNGRDVTWEIRSPRVDANVSPVSVVPGVRAALTAQQRKIGLRGRVVMVGRDIGTVVVPEAGIKVYLEASAEERARRRHQELLGRGEKADYGAILADIRRRDRIDSTRAVAPLRPADDAIRLDSDHLTAEEVFAQALELVRAHMPPA